MAGRHKGRKERMEEDGEKRKEEGREGGSCNVKENATTEHLFLSYSKVPLHSLRTVAMTASFSTGFREQVE